MLEKQKGSWFSLMFSFLENSCFLVEFHSMYTEAWEVGVFLGSLVNEHTGSTITKLYMYSLGLDVYQHFGFTATDKCFSYVLSALVK